MKKEHWPDHDEVWIEFHDGKNDSYDPVYDVYEKDDFLVVDHSTEITYIPMEQIKSWVKRKFWREES